MAKSSIHIGPGNSGYFFHNDRSQKTVNSIFHDERGSGFRTGKQAIKVYREELKKRSNAYKKRTGQKLQKKAITHLSAIVNLNQNHEMIDIQKVAMYLEKTLDTAILQIAIHRDEGHIDEDGNPVKNYHAHIEFMGLDSEGGSVRKKLTKGYLTRLQDKTAKMLNMERGHNYAKENLKRPKRLDTYDFKEAKIREEEARAKEKAARKDLEAENKRLRAELKELNAQRSEYATLEAEIKELRALVKEKDLTLDEMAKRIEELEEDLIDMAVSRERDTDIQLSRPPSHSVAKEEISPDISSPVNVNIDYPRPSF
jgi:hypothetical protein